MISDLSGGLQLVHSDVCGPMDVESFSWKKYFVTFIDDLRRCSAIYFIKFKAEVLVRQSSRLQTQRTKFKRSVIFDIVKGNDKPVLRLVDIMKMVS